jgi:hypothetical protein
MIIKGWKTLMWGACKEKIKMQNSCQHSLYKGVWGLVPLKGYGVKSLARCIWSKQQNDYIIQVKY